MPGFGGGGGSIRLASGRCGFAASPLGSALRLRAARRRLLYASRNAAVWMVLRGSWRRAVGADGLRKMGFFAASCHGLFLRVAPPGLWDSSLFPRPAQD